MSSNNIRPGRKIRADLLDVGGSLARRLFGRTNLCRAGRVLTDWGDLLGRNNLHINGEQLVQAAYLRAFQFAGNHVWDIGANRGDWSAQLVELLAASPRRASPVAIELFEPDPGAFAFVSSRPLAVAGIATTAFHSLAVSSEEGIARFHQVKPLSGINSLVRPPDCDASALRAFDVSVTTVDAHARSIGLDRIGLIKCDTEGNDFEVLLGARSMLSEGHIGIFQFEYNHRWVYARRLLADVYSLVHGMPYRLARVTPFGVDPQSAWRRELESFRETNWVLVRHDLFPMFDIAPTER